MSINAYNKKDINSLGNVLKILGEPNRLHIVTSLGLECRPVSDIIKEMDANMSKESWEEFEFRFNDVHNEFYDNLIKDFPDLTPNELKLCAFLKLNMTSKDIATITYQTNHSITVARHRLRIKLGLERDDNLISFLSKY